MHLAFLGFGLIAGSIARAVRARSQADDWTIAAWSPSGRGPAQALADGVIDTAAARPEDVFDGCDLLVLAAPATRCLALIDDLAGPWRDRMPSGMTVTDVASTKGRLVARADAAGLRFVGGHPMAGLEQTGYHAADGGLFVDRPWVVVPGAASGPDDRRRVADLAGACGARVVEMDADRHDAAVAAISHLPLLAAAALVESVAGGDHDEPGGRRAVWADAAPLAAGGWRDSTRVARGDPAMGAAIAVTNATALARRVRALRAVLDSWLVDLDGPGGPDEAAIAARLAAARARLEELP